jgi:tetratricopeptide (TPR) repeat protein
MKLLCRLFAYSLLGIVLVAAAAADDVVIVRAQRPNARVKKQGEIVDWIGGELRLRGALNREEVIPSSRIIEVQSDWTEAQRQAESLRAAGKVDEAIAAWRRAYREETRPWAGRRIAAELAVAYLETGRADLAGEAFLTILASDPQTDLFAAAPLAWRPVSPDSALIARAAAWLGSSDPAARLLGASWLLATSQRTAAVAALEELTRDDDRRIAAAAEIQLWRTKIVSATPAEITRWQTAAEKVPAELRGVAWYVIGDALARRKKSEEAALAYLRTALTYYRQRAMAADALVAAADQLEALGRAEQAAGLYQEVVSDYSATAAAVQAKDRLARMSEAASKT